MQIFGQTSSKLDILRLLLMFILFLAARARAFLALLLCFLSALLYFSAFYQYNGRLTARRAAASVGAKPHSCAPARRSRRAPPATRAAQAVVRREAVHTLVPQQQSRQKQK